MIPATISNVMVINVRMQIFRSRIPNAVKAAGNQNMVKSSSERFFMVRSSKKMDSEHIYFFD